MPEEVLKYRIQIDESSLTGELARTRGAITNALQQAVHTGQYAVNNIHNDLAMARTTMAMPVVPTYASASDEMRMSPHFLLAAANQGMGGAPGFSQAVASPFRDFGFMGSAAILAGGATPVNMMSDEARWMARRELDQRAYAMSAGIGRQAVPVAGSLAGFALGGPIGGAAGYFGGDLIAGAAFKVMEQRQVAGDILAMTRAPHPMRPFSRDQQDELARGLAMDVAKDVRFGIEDLSQLLASGQSMDMFAGTRSVDEFRSRFRSMMEQVRSITRVFQQTTGEAMETLGQLGQMGPAQAMGGRIADIHALSRMGGMPAQQAMAIGMGGAQMAAAAGIPMAAGFDAMTRNAQMAIAEIGRASCRERV